VSASQTPNILIVDSEASFREHLCTCLARASYRCTGVASARAALGVLRDSVVDVALLDAGDSTHDDGIWLAKRMRLESRALAVVLLTSTRNLDAAIDAMQVGVLDYLFKPFSSDELLEVVERALTWRRAAVKAGERPFRLEQEIVNRTSRLKQCFAECGAVTGPALETMVQQIYAEHRDALDHVLRVSRHAAGLAAAMGFEEPLVTHVAQAGLLHDVGKLALPDAIAAKPTPLTDHEFALARMHPDLAVEMVSGGSALEPVAEIVGAVRERFDGTGYPDGVRGDDIPIGARVVALVDAFDSLAGGQRLHQPASISAANAHLVRSAGLHFDPDVVAAWLRYADAVLPSDEPENERKL
jgi:response regulator RpfG family c-di-GMP phosphodiesterase